jgi:predicted AAA+ superfamily ATPase
MKIIKRKHYLKTLSVLKDKNLIKVATGVRRCGKSTLMIQFQGILREENPGASILSINMDMPEFRFLAEKNWKEIYNHIITNLKKNITYIYKRDKIGFIILYLGIYDEKGRRVELPNFHASEIGC